MRRAEGQNDFFSSASSRSSCTKQARNHGQLSRSQRNDETDVVRSRDRQHASIAVRGAGHVLRAVDRRVGLLSNDADTCVRYGAERGALQRYVCVSMEHADQSACVAAGSSRVVPSPMGNVVDAIRCCSGGGAAISSALSTSAPPSSAPATTDCSLFPSWCPVVSDLRQGGQSRVFEWCESLLRLVSGRLLSDRPGVALHVDLAADRRESEPLCSAFCQCRWNTSNRRCEVHSQQWREPPNRQCCTERVGGGIFATPMPTPPRTCPTVGTAMQCPMQSVGRHVQRSDRLLLSVGERLLSARASRPLHANDASAVRDVVCMRGARRPVREGDEAVVHQ
jgi:hypothetical protein